MTITLRIKKVWFDEIRHGHKTTEYRVASKYNDALIAKRPLAVKFHYQGPDVIMCPVLSIRKIRIEGKLHWAIDLGKVHYWVKPSHKNRRDRGQSCAPECICERCYS